MTVGYPFDKPNVDNLAGALVVRIRDSLEEAVDFKAKLDSRSDADLLALGYAQDDVDLLRASFTDLAALNSVATGQQATGASNFFFNAQHLTGTR